MENSSIHSLSSRHVNERQIINAMFLDILHVSTRLKKKKRSWELGLASAFVILVGVVNSLCCLGIFCPLSSVCFLICLISLKRQNKNEDIVFQVYTR